MRRRIGVMALATGLLVSMGVVAAGSSGAQGAAPSFCKDNVQKAALKIKNDCMLSSGGRMVFDGPQSTGPGGGPNGIPPSFGSNHDAADPSEDVASGQSETSIAASGGNLIASWNDASGFIVSPSTKLQASLTGVGWSRNGGGTWTDAVGLPNNVASQQWAGDPTVVAIDSTHFIVGSLYVPACFIQFINCGRRAASELALSVATFPPSGPPTFTNPIVAVSGGSIFEGTSGFLDKEFLAYDPNTRTLALSYTNFAFNPPQTCGDGEIDLVRATVPADPATLSSGDWSAPIIVAPDIGGDCGPKFQEQEGAYPAVAPNGDIYVAWERNWFTNFFQGDPYVYVMAAYIPAEATAPTMTVTASRNSPGAQKNGGFKSLDTTTIPGYNRGIGQEFPRIAYDTTLGQVVVAWNTGALHPLGDIVVKGMAPGLADRGNGLAYVVNDDSSFAMHFLPGLSIRSDGSICTSWYDRRNYGASSALTDYWGECRPDVSTNTADFNITTGPTDWTNTGSFIVPNFGDYTDNASDGTTTYYLWSDGRVGVPNPFEDSHT